MASIWQMAMKYAHDHAFESSITPSSCSRATQLSSWKMTVRLRWPLTRSVKTVVASKVARRYWRQSEGIRRNQKVSEDEGREEVLEAIGGSPTEGIRRNQRESEGIRRNLRVTKRDSGDGQGVIERGSRLGGGAADLDAAVPVREEGHQRDDVEQAQHVRVEEGEVLLPARDVPVN